MQVDESCHIGTPISKIVFNLLIIIASIYLHIRKHEEDYA